MSVEYAAVHRTANTDLFSPENLTKLKQITYDQVVPVGSHLFWEGDTADKLFYIKSGRIKITKSTDDGKQLILYMYQNGDLFGQVDFYKPATQSFNAEAVEETVVGLIQQKDLEVLLWQHGDLAIEFMNWMGQIHRITQTKFRDLMMFGKPGALCSVLIRLTNTYGKINGRQALIPIRLTNTELAEMIGATRESVNRMLSDLKKQDIIDYKDNFIVVKDMAYLRDLCHCENCPNSICRI